MNTEVSGTTEVLTISPKPALQKPPFAPDAVRDTGALVATPTPADLLRFAMQSGSNIDLDRMERLMQMQITWEEREAKKAFIAAMAAFKTEPLEIFKRKEVDFKTRDGQRINYMHAELSDVTEAITPVMGRHGLNFTWEIQQDKGTITVHCVVTHVLGHSERVTMSGAPDESGRKNAIQQVASTITYLQRYTLLSATGMSTKGMDDDGAGGADEAGTDTGSQTPVEPTFYDQATFDSNLPKWSEIIESGKQKADRLIAFINSKAGKTPLSEEQKAALKAIKAKENVNASA